jgi:hypothetical protein
VPPSARGRHLVVGGLALAFLIAHLLSLPSSLEDLDSINFALGLRRFDVAQHQPHPPGYPLYIAVGKIVHTMVPDEAKALGALSAVTGALGVFALMALFTGLDERWAWRWPAAAALVTVTCPLYWFTAARPLSDVPGLAAAVAIQAVTLTATSTKGLVVATFLAALATGLRSQVAWLTAPLLLVAFVRHRPVEWRHAAVNVFVAGVAGTAVWAVPLVLLSGGPTAYWRALFAQGAEDLSGIRMLWTTPTPRALIDALYYALVAPWVVWPLAIGVGLSVAAGAWSLSRRAPQVLLSLAAAFGPYFIFDLVFQETFTSRYALPLVPPVVYLAARGLATIPGPPGFVVALCGAAVCWTLSTVSVGGYARVDAPAFRLLADMRRESSTARPSSAGPVLAMHRREDLDLRRPMEWLGSDLPMVSQRLSAPPKHEWLELVKYWNGGGSSPVWFVADPRRTDMALIDHSRDRRGVYRWSLPYPVLLSGTRPSEMDWHIVDAPGWYLGEGWSLTPETAGVAAEDHRGPGLAPIAGWIRRRREPLTLMIGGRHLEAVGPSARVSIAIDDRPIETLNIPPGFFLHMVNVPKEALVGEGDYARLTVWADQPRVAIEQFDAQSAPERLVFGFGEGWHEMEYNPTTARTWRWISERGVLRAQGGAGPLRLAITGETGVSRPTSVSVRVGDRAVARWTVDGPFSEQVEIPAASIPSADTWLTIDSDQFFVPAERSRRSADRRHLALRIFDVRLSR